MIGVVRKLNKRVILEILPPYKINTVNFAINYNCCQLKTGNLTRRSSGGGRMRALVADNSCNMVKFLRIYHKLSRYGYLNSVLKGTVVERVKKLGRLNKKQLAHKAKKTRKPKRRQTFKTRTKPYQLLLTNTKAIKRRGGDHFIKFDKHRVVVFSDPIRFGPAGKSTMVPVLVGTRFFTPLCRELRQTPDL